jgi:hypothetical protein
MPTALVPDSLCSRLLQIETDVASSVATLGAMSEGGQTLVKRR